MGSFALAGINRVMMERPQIQQPLGDVRFREKSDEEIVIGSVLFRVLNVRYELHFARSEPSSTPQ